MRGRRKKLQLVVVVAIVVVAAAFQAINQAPKREAVVVTRVIDGDTIVVEGGSRVRLLDIDTTERGEPCYTEATDRLKELIDGKEVVLESKNEDKDVYGRLLRYVFLNDTLINLVMVREGWANLYIEDEGPYHQQFIEAEQSAKQENGCVWK